MPNPRDKEKPMLFAPLMASAVFSGTKTQTRRLVKLGKVVPLRAFETASGRRFAWCDEIGRGEAAGEADFLKLSRIQVGDRLWVREAFRLGNEWDDESPAQVPPQMHGLNTPTVWYEGTDSLLGPPGGGWGRNRSSLHMPRWACRTVLEVTKVRVERVESITDEDALAEGFRCKECGYTLADAQLHMDHYICEARGNRGAAAAFLDYFYNVVNRAAPKSNPFVWAYEFKREVPNAQPQQ